MPADQHDDHARQLEALRQHMVHPDTRWEPPAGLGLSDEQAAVAVAGLQRRRRPSLAWLLVTGLLVAVALVGGVFVGAVAWSDDRPAARDTNAGTASARRGAEAAAVTPVATLECKTAVDRANAMLASAVKLRGALAEHDRILNDPANRELAVGQVLQQLAVSQQAGSSESARFDRALDAYRQVVDRCDLRVP
jgi:hypothetical protein